MKHPGLYTRALKGRRSHLKNLHCPRRGAENKAFTLLELLSTIAIVSLLAALLFTGVTRANESAKRTKCVGNLRQIGLGLNAYANDNGQKFPSTSKDGSTWDNTLIQGQYLTKEVFKCPSDRMVRKIPGDIRSYGCNGYIVDNASSSNPLTVQQTLLRITKPLSQIIFVADRSGPTAVINRTDYAAAYITNDCLTNHKTGANCLFGDMHVDWVTNIGSDPGSIKNKQFWLPN